MRQWIVAGALVLMVSGCGDPKLDGSSEQAFRESASDVRDSLSSENREEFDQALLRLTMQDVDLGNLMTQDPESMIQGGIGKLDGLTGEEVLQKAREHREQQRQDELASMEDELEGLEAKLAKMDKAKDQLEHFVVMDAFFSHEGQGLERRPIVELKVRNDTGQPVSRAYFTGIVGSPERATPWIKSGFNYEIPGGVEPGETASWVLELNPYGDWGTEVPDLNYLKLEVVRLDGPTGKTLWELTELSPYERERLEQLRAEL